MAQQSVELKATARPRAGKGAARQARREGKVPAVIYGDSKTPETDRARLQRSVEAVHQGPLHLHGDGARCRRHQASGDPARHAGRSDHGPSDPRRLSAHRQGWRHPRRRAGQVRQRSVVARPEAWRRPQHRAPRRRGVSAPTTRCPPSSRWTSPASRSADRSTSRPCRCRKASRRPSRPRLHRRHHRRRREAGRGDAGC